MGQKAEEGRSSHEPTLDPFQAGAFFFSAAVTREHKTPDSLAFESRLAPALSWGLSGLQPGTGAVSLVPLAWRLPAS
jgi:hypothetical protein